MSNIIAICIGHSRRVHGRHEGGAISWDDSTSEWTYNKTLGERVFALLASAGVPAVVIADYEGESYGSAQRWLAGRLRSLDADIAVELHFNSSDDPQANGQEMLYWHQSVRGRSLAQSISDEFAAKIGELKNRGIKPKSSADRGAEFLRGTHCPACIVESGFGSNFGDWEIMTTRREQVAGAIASGIISHIGRD